MNTNYKVSFSIVLFKQDPEEIRAVLQSLLLYKGEKHIYILENSPTAEFADVVKMDECISYYHQPSNIGFGAAHNKAFAMAREYGSKYHFVVNPDISYEKDVVFPMVSYMDEHPEIGQMMPRILYPDGRKQYLPKLTPSPRMMFWRKMKRPAKIHEAQMRLFEMRPMADDKVYDVACVTGCFSVLRMEALNKVGDYDGRFFMYFEDTDLARRLHKVSRTVYFPLVSVKHAYCNGAAKHSRLFFIFLASFFKYFCKWGWIFDAERKLINAEILRQID